MTQVEETQPRKKRSSALFKISVVLFVLCLGLIAATAFLYQKYQEAQNNEAFTATSLLETLSQTVELPDEQPTIVTVNDKERLNNQILAERVENQDLLLIFNAAQRLIVYRPSNEKIIDMLTFSPEDNVIESEDSPQIDTSIPQ